MPIHAWKNALAGCVAYPELLPAVTVPVLIIWGTADGFFGKQDQMDLISRLGSTHIDFRVKEGRGHDLFSVDHVGEELALDIYKFLQEIK
jgi:pimeloyl-ACP methyl ester carboxylesterase